MKLSFAFLFACVLVAAVGVMGCGDSEVSSQPDTTPPLAPVMAGAQTYGNGIGIWWHQNSEPDLAGYHVYMVQDGQTQRLTSQPITDTEFAAPVEASDRTEVFVTALDWSGNESSPSAPGVLIGSPDGGRRPVIGGIYTGDPKDR